MSEDPESTQRVLAARIARIEQIQQNMCNAHLELQNLGHIGTPPGEGRAVPPLGASKTVEIIHTAATGDVGNIKEVSNDAFNAIKQTFATKYTYIEEMDQGLDLLVDSLKAYHDVPRASLSELGTNDGE